VLIDFILADSEGKVLTQRYILDADLVGIALAPVSSNV
jgi:hypothetical protein